MSSASTSTQSYSSASTLAIDTNPDPNADQNRKISNLFSLAFANPTGNAATLPEPSNEPSKQGGKKVSQAFGNIFAMTTGVTGVLKVCDQRLLF